MMLHAPVLALLLTAWLGAATLLWAAGFAITLLRHWDLASGARRQIELERRTHLVATLLTLVMLAQAVALPLMVFNADRTAPLLVGAMCAFGSFNASVYGFPALYAKLALFFGAVVWLAMHHADLRSTDYALTRRKYGLLLVLLPLALADAGLAAAYFADLKADTLTSCCGSAFNPERTGVAAEAASLDPQRALGLLTAALAASLLVGRPGPALARRRRSLWRSEHALPGCGAAGGGGGDLAVRLRAPAPPLPLLPAQAGVRLHRLRAVRAAVRRRGQRAGRRRLELARAAQLAGLAADPHPAAAVLVDAGLRAFQRPVRAAGLALCTAAVGSGAESMSYREFSVERPLRRSDLSPLGDPSHEVFIPPGTGIEATSLTELASIPRRPRAPPSGMRVPSA
jgi:hypothetical protein